MRSAINKLAGSDDNVQKNHCPVRVEKGEQS